MTSNFPEFIWTRAPILVLGVGNTLLGDDGVGPAVIHQFFQMKEDRWKDRVEFLDGGTQGLALLGHLSGREAIIVVDALSMGAPAGGAKILNLCEVFRMGVNHANSSHEGNAGELLAMAKVLGELPDRVFVVGVEPQSIETRCGLSESVHNALPIAAKLVRKLLAELNCLSLPRVQPEAASVD
jgi:hydrogenase maturation protease